MNETPEAAARGTDRIGTSQVLAAASLVRSGRTYDLGTDLGGGMPEPPSSTFGPYRWLSYRRPDPASPAFQFSMDLLMGSPHVSSHIDGLAHIQHENRIHGGATVADALTDRGWTRNGIETTPPIVGRGLLLDVPAYLAKDRMADDDVVTTDVVLGCLARQHLEVREGDVVLIRTGKIAEYKAGDAAYYGSQPGVGRDAALWLYERGMAVLGTDTSGTEPIPFADPEHTTHRAMIVERGVHLLEILDLDGLAADRVFEFMFVCTPLRIVGATGSWVRPVAIV